MLKSYYVRGFVMLIMTIVVLFAIMSQASAQELGPVAESDIAPTVAAEPEFTGLAGVANSILAGAASALALVIGALITRLWNVIPEWVRSIIDKIQTADSVQWRENIREAAFDALTHATARLQIDPASISTWEEKNAFLKVAGTFVERFDPDIKALIDKDRNGIPDILEVALAKIAPQTALLAQPAAQQAFFEPAPPAQPAAQPQRRAVIKRAEGVGDIAAKFATRRPAGAKLS